MELGMFHGGEKWAPVDRKRLGCALTYLQNTPCQLDCNLDVLIATVAGQGVHREVESEGYEAKRRAVAETGEPVGQIRVIPSLHYGGEGSTWNALTQQGVCGRHGGEETCVTSGDLLRSRPTWMGNWAYKPQGEIAGDAVGEVGVVSGTHEPQNNRNCGTVSFVGQRAGGPKDVGQGEGATLEMANGVRRQASRWRRTDGCRGLQ